MTVTDVKNIIDKAVEDNPSPTEIIQSLAKLSPIEYEQQRESVAKRLNIRVSALDQEVKKFRLQNASENNEKSKDIFPIIEPWPDPVAAEELLQEISDTCKRFAILPEHADTVLALWVTFTWLIDYVDVSPILAIASPEKRCGKTTVISVLGKLVCKPILASNISAPALFRTIESWSPTIIIDEADTFLKDSDELRGILNSGHTRSAAYVVRTVGDDHIPTQFSTWGAKAIALIGNLPDTLQDRSIAIQLRRKLAHENIEKLRHADKIIFDDLCRKLSRFAQDQAQIIKNSRPNFPEHITISDRALDNWEPLLAIANLAGEQWTQRVYQAALALSADDVENLTIGTELLHDIQKVFEDKGEEWIRTTDLIAYLCEDEESRWSTYNFRGQDKKITPRQLSKQLKEYGIHSKSIRVNEKVLRGFEKYQFEEAWRRYVTSSNSPPELSATPLHNHSQASTESPLSVADSFDVTATNCPVADTEFPSATLQSQPSTSIHGNCSGVADNLGGLEDKEETDYEYGVVE